MLTGHAFTLLFAHFTNTTSGPPRTVLSKLECARVCVENRGCSSFFYSPDAKACITSSKSYIASTKLSPAPGMYYYSMPKKINQCGTGGKVCDVNAECKKTRKFYSCQCNSMYEGNGHVCTLKHIKREVCTRHPDCIRSNFICIDGLCVCSDGFSYNGKSTTCVKKCDVYGTQFTLQSPPRCIFGYNAATFKTSRYDDCRVNCLKASFTCKSFELWNKKCYLSSKAKSDVTSFLWRPMPGCRYYQRDCA